MVSVLLIHVALSIAAPPEAPAAADPFRIALIEAVHCFAKDGKLAHLQAILDKYPELREARREHPIDKKPTTFDHDTPLQTAARYGAQFAIAVSVFPPIGSRICFSASPKSMPRQPGVSAALDWAWRSAGAWPR